MAFSGIVKLFKDWVTGTPTDTDYFLFGNTDIKKITFANLRKALGIDALNSALVGFGFFERRYLCTADDPVSIDGVKYTNGKSVTISGIRSTNISNKQRGFIIATVTTSENGDIYSKYVLNNKIIVLKFVYDNTPSFSKGWYSLN